MKCNPTNKKILALGKYDITSFFVIDKKNFVIDQTPSTAIFSSQLPS